MMNSLLSLDELLNFMCWMLMKIDSIMGIGKKKPHLLLFGRTLQSYACSQHRIEIEPG